MKKLLFFLTFLSFIVGCDLGPGLIISPLISGIIKWQEGEAHKYYGYDSTTVYRAVKRSSQELNYQILKDSPDENGRDFYMVVGENDRFKVKIKHVEPYITKLSIRINFMGDKPYAELFYKQVDEGLSVIDFDDDGLPVRNGGLE